MRIQSGRRPRLPPSFSVVASGPLPLFDQVVAWLKATQTQDGPDYHMGLNMALPAEMATPDLAARMREEAVAHQAVIVLPAIIGAWSRKPRDQAWSRRSPLLARE